jgi:hypothetical protein
MFHGFSPGQALMAPGLDAEMAFCESRFVALHNIMEGITSVFKIMLTCNMIVLHAAEICFACVNYLFCMKKQTFMMGLNKPAGP